MKYLTKTLLALALAALTILVPNASRAATFGWSGSGSGTGTGAGTAWLTAGNWTNNAGTPTNLDIALFGLGGTAAGIGFNFNGPAATTTNIGVISLVGGSTSDRTIGNSSTTAGIQTRLYHFGVSGGLFTNAVAGRTLSFLPFASGGSGHGMTNVIMAGGNIEAVGNINFVSQFTDDGVARNITKSGNGQLILSTNNAFLGTFTVNFGGLTVKNSGSLGTGTKTISLANGTAGHTHMILDNTGNGADINLPSTLSFTTSHTAGTVTNTAGNNVIQGNFTMSAGGDTTIIANGGTLTTRGTFAPNTTGRNLRLGGTSTGANTASGPITGSGANAVGFFKQDSGTWNLTGTNTYTGNSTISAGTLILGANGSISNSPTITVAAGAVFNVAAVSGGFAIETNQTLNGAGTVIGAVTFKNGSTNAGTVLFVNAVTVNSGSRIQPGGLFVPGTTVVSNALTLNGGSTLNFDLASTPIVNAGSNDLIVVNGNLSITGPVPITFSFPLGQPQLGVPYTLVRYSGTLSGGANLSVVGLSSPSATLDASVPGIITVTFTAAAGNDIVWTGTNGFNWNLATTVNFSNAAGAEVSFSQGDNVLFDDSSTNQAVTLVGNNLQPATTTVNSSSNFTFSGAGALAGGSLTKSGTGTLAVNTPNSYAGATLIQGGTLRAGNAAALGNAVGGTTISSGATLDVNGQNLGQEPVVVSGTGVGGLGAIVNSGGQQLNAIKFLTLTADTTFGGAGRWDVRANSGNGSVGSGGQPYKLTKVGVNMVALVDTVVDPALGEIDVQAGTFSTESFTQLGDPTKTMTIWSNATFRFWANTVPVTKVMVMSNTAKFFVENSTANAFNGTINMVEGTNFFDINVSSALSITGNISGAAALIKTNTGTLSLFGTNTYTGVTYITNGLLQGTTLSVPGAVTNNAGLVINQNFDGTLVGPVVGVGGTFIKRGTGRVTITTPMGITGTVTNEAGTLALGADNVLGTGLLDWRGAGGLFPAFESSDASPRTLVNALSISTDTRLGSATSGNLVFSGPVNNGGAQKILTVSNAMTTFSSGFGNVGTVVKAGSGLMVLGGANNNTNLVITNGTLALAAGGYFSNNPVMTIIGGAVLDVSAGSGATFTNAAGRTLTAGRTSGFANDIVGGLQSTGTITIGAALFPTAATLTVSGGALIGGGLLNFDLASVMTTGAGVNDFINVGGVITLSGSITTAVNQVNGSLANGTYTLMTGTAPVVGAPTFFLTGTNGMRQTAAVSIAGNSVILTVSGTDPAPLAWRGTAGNNWDINTAVNWSNIATLALSAFFNSDSVLFDDTSANTNVQIATPVSPLSVTVNSSSNYTLAGAGLIAGGASIAKAGSGTLSLGNANTFFGPVSITGGTLKQSAAGALGNSAGVSATGGGQFDFAGFATTSKALSFTIAGAGPDGLGAIKNTGGNVAGSAISNVTLTADATIGAVGTGGDGGRMDIGVGYGLLNGNGNKLTKIGPGFLNIRSSTINLPEIIVSGGTVYTENIDNNLGAKVTVQNGGRLGGTGARLYTNTVDLLAGSTFFTAVGNSFSTWSGPINVLGQSAFGAATIAAGAGAQDLRIVGPFNGSGNIVLSVAPLEFTGNNDATFSGNISVNATTLRLTTNGTHGTGVITNNSGTVEFNVFNNIAYARNIYGPGGTVRKANTNLFQLTGASGDQISDALVLDVTGGVFDLNGRSEGVRGLTGNLGTLVTNSGGSTVSLVLTNPNANPHVYNGSIAGPITVVVRDSATRNGVLQSFTGTNTFTGGLIIDNGQLRSSGDWVLGAVPGSYDPANIILRNNGTIQNNASTLFIHPNRGIVIEGDATFMAGFSVGNDVVVNGSITGPGRLLKADGQKLILKNANSFTGDTVFTNIAGAGTLRLDHTYALQNSTFDATGLGGANGTLDLNNMDIVVGMLKGSGATLANFNGRLTAGGNGQNGVFGSALSGAGNLVKVGPGILALTAANPYNGGTIVSNGTLVALGNLSGFGAVVVKSGATFGSSATVSGPVTIEPGASVYPGASVGTLTVNNHFSVNSGALFYELASVNNTGGGINDLINVQSNLTLSGSTLVRFSFVHGAPALGVPYVLMTYAGALSGSAANLTSDTRYTTTFDNSVAGQIRVTFTGAGGSNLVWTGSTTNNTWNLGTFTNFYNGLSLDTFKDADSVTFDDSGYAGAPVILDGLLSPTVLTIDAAQDYTFAGVGHLNMAGRLVKLGAGKLTLANTNDFIGSFNVGAGTLSVALEESLGLAPVAAINQIFLPGGTLQAAGTFTLNSNRRIAVGPTNTAGSGAIEVTGTNVLSYGGIVGNNLFGVGTLVKRGPGRLSLSAANTYSGGTMISKGTLSIRNANALGTIGAITLGDAGSGSDDLTLLLETSAGNITLTRDINVSSTGSGVVTIGSTALPLPAVLNDMRFSGNIALANRDLALRSGGGNVTFFGGDILGIGNIIITNGSLTGDVGGGQAGNRVIWDNLPKSFTGDITILGGTVTPIYTNFTVLQMNTANIIRDTANVIVQTNAIFRLNADENINGLTGLGRVRGVVSLRTLGVGANNASSIFNGMMENDPVNGGALALTKLGSGVLTLNGANSYTGGTIAGAGTLALGANGSFSNSTSLIVSNGATFDVSAVSGGYVLMGNQTLNGFGTVLGNITLASNATVNAGLLNVVGTLGVTGNLGLNNSNRFNFELGSVPAGPGNDQLMVSGDLNISGVSYITVNAASPLAAGTYTLITCSGTKSSAGAAANFVLINNTASLMTLGESANAITLTVTTAGRSLVWAANFTNSVWDINNTTNWLNSGLLGSFLAGDGVGFDSTAQNSNVTVAVTLLPSIVSFTGATNYALSGAGKISGAASLTQNSTSTNTIGLANDFSGSVTINGGVLKAGNAAALGNTTGATIINPGGTLDVNNLNLGTELFVVSGAGYQGQGAIVNGSGAGQINATRFVTLAGDTTFGGVARWDVRGASAAQQGSFSSGGLPYKLTKLGVNTVSIVDTLVDPALGDVDVVGGVLSLETSSSGLGDPSRTLRIGNNASFQFFSLPIPLNKQIEMTNGSAIINASGANIIVGPITLLGSNFFNIGGTSLALSNTISGAGQIWKGGGSTLLLAGNNTYNGGAVLQAGTTIITGTEPNSGGYSNVATLNVGNFGNSGSLGGLITNNGTINLQRADASSFSAGVLGQGTINHVSGSGPVTLNGNITNANLNVRSGNGAILTLGAGNYSITNLTVGNTPSGWLNILPGATVGIPNTYFVGDASGGQTGVVVQTGGDVTVGNQFRFGHWPNNVSTYLMGGGSLSLTTVSATTPSGGGEQNGGFYIGIDGVAIFTQTGGVVNVPGLVLDNRGSSFLGAATNTYDLRGGTLTLGQWGFASPNSTYQINLGGGTVASSINWTSTLNMRLTGAGGDVAFNPASFNNFLFGVLSGPGGLSKAGSGSLLLSNASTFTGNTLISGGTLALVGAGGIASSPNISVGSGAVLDATAKTGGLVVGAGQTLSGNGTILGLTTINGAVLPGTSIGTLTFGSALTLAGSTTMEIDRSAGQNADLITAPSVAYGGALVVTNTGTALQSGDTFNLFDGTISGSFSSLTLPALGAGLYWDTSNLGVNGTLRVGDIAYVVTPPASQTNECGTLVTFTVVAGGDAPISYQWFQGATPISGATTDTFVTNATPANAGAYTVQVINAGGTNSASATLTVVDTIAPSVICPADIAAECTSPAGAIVTFTASATDSCDASPSLNCVPASGSTFAIGTNIVTCTATDSSLNTNACTFTITVADTTPPVITTYATNRTLSAGAACQLAIPDLTSEVVATDICGPVTITQSPVAGTLVPLGMTNITLTVTDPASNAVTHLAIITVADTTAPSILSCAPATNIIAGTNCTALLPDLTGLVSASDCNGPVTVTQDPAAGTVLNLGPNVVTLNVVDAANNTNTCTATVTVVDGTPPAIIACALDQTLTADMTGMAVIPDLTGQVTYSDNCGPVTVSQSPIAGTVVGLGNQVVTLTATDGATNFVMCQATVTVSSAPVAPSIVNEPPDRAVPCTSNTTVAVVATGTTPLSYQWYFNANLIGDATNASLALSDVRPAQVGGYQVVVTNALGSVTSRVAVVSVVDTAPPVLVCSSNLLVKTSATNGTVVSYSASVTDACDPSPSLGCVPASGSLFPLGNTTVTCSSADANGNSNSCSFVVNVILAGSTNAIVNTDVPDGSALGLASVIQVASPIGALTDVNVTLNISNGWNGDLFAYLVHDSGYAVLLNRAGKRLTDPLGYDDAGFDITLDDQAADDIHNYRYALFNDHGTPLGGPLTGSWKPDGRAIDPALVLDTDPRTAHLSSFNGLNPNGEWALFVQDDATGDVSKLVSWSLELCGTAGVAPTIQTQPQGTNVGCGDSVTLTVGATGTGPVGYHWSRNGIPVPGAQSATLAFPAILPTQAGTYSVIVSNAFGSVVSDMAVVVVNDQLPFVVTPPVSRTNNVGTTAILSTVVVSCSPLSYQWCLGPNPLPGATNATLVFTNVQLSQAGTYTVKLSNFTGSVTTAPVVLTVNRPPVAGDYGAATTGTRPVSISVAKLLYVASDADGDPLTVTPVATSTNGGSVTLGGGSVTYMPLPGFQGIDRFSFTVSDGRGGSDIGEVQVLVVNGSLPGLNQVSITPTAHGVLVRFAGVPGYTYNLQRAPTVTGPWSTIVTRTAPIHGIIEYEDTTAMGAAFYRTVTP